MPTDTIAVMMPKSMTFKAGPSTPYTPVTEETTAQTYVARNVEPSQALDFTVSGAGQLPRDSEAAAAAGRVERRRRMLRRRLAAGKCGGDGYAAGWWVGDSA